MSDSSMEKMLGLLRIRIHRGINLAIRDVHLRSSDPYVVVRMGKQVIYPLPLSLPLSLVLDLDLSQCTYFVFRSQSALQISCFKKTVD